ncbi:MAG: hypothetical protein M1831_007321 [Alyxoria varia]|nr:MAG: hypothetical protein M1831_007321 [Alyxoria varia]
MGLFWPWKGSDNSAATFEKTLSTLSNKISKANTHDTLLRTRSRRFKALWTLYTSFVYITYTLISVLVTGREKWGPVEYTVIASSPVAFVLSALLSCDTSSNEILRITGVRYLLSTYYSYRISSNDAHLEDLRGQKREAIEKFKDATKYNSTQQLLDKYGTDAESPAAKDSKKAAPKKKNAKKAPAQNPNVTHIPPPSTANIQRAMNTQKPQGPQSTQTSQIANPPTTPVTPNVSPRAVSGPNPISPSNYEEFAPNAEAAPSQYIGPGTESGHWYDRLLDLLLGEDETRPVNRLALICTHCRLVNGQAPPGIKRLEDLGRWRCFQCKGWNGEENNVKSILDSSANTSHEGLAKGEANEAEERAPTKTEEEPLSVKAEDDETQKPSAPRESQ